MAIKVHGATVIDNSKHITVSGAQVDGTLLLPEAGLLQVSKDNGSIGQFGASDTELITIGNSVNSKNIILRSSGFADFKQVNVNQILKVGGDKVQIDPDGSATFASHQFRVETSGETIIDSPAVAAGSALFSCRSALNSGNIVASITADGSATFAGTVDAAGLTVNGSPVSGNVDLSGYDTSAEVDAKIAAIPATDLSGYDTSTEVDAKIAAIPSVDLAGYDTTAQVNAKIANLENALINGAPEALNTLVELSTALGDDANFATTVTNSLAGKADLSGSTFSGNIELGDNNRLKFGNSDDLQIYHDGNNSIVRESGAGQLYLEGGGTIAIRNTDQSTINASFHAGSQGQQLFHQGSKKFETTSTGINVTGNVEATYFMGNLSGNVLNSQGQVVIDVDNPDFGLPFSGGTMTGDIVMGSPAVSTIGIDGDASFAGSVTATYFIGNLSGNILNSQGQVVIDVDNPSIGSPTIISDTVPSTTNTTGTLWWNSNSSDNSLYVLYEDPSGPSGDSGGKYWIEIVANGSSSSYISSDYRLKENVVNISDGISRVKQLNPRRFNFITDADTTVDGFLAHEAQTVVPESVSGTHTEVDAEGNPVMQRIDQSKLVPLLTAALQEAIAKIETLETKMSALEAG